MPDRNGILLAPVEGEVGLGNRLDSRWRQQHSAALGTEGQIRVVVIACGLECKDIRTESTGMLLQQGIGERKTVRVPVSFPASRFHSRVPVSFPRFHSRTGMLLQQGIGERKTVRVPVSFPGFIPRVPVSFPHSTDRAQDPDPPKRVAQLTARCCVNAHEIEDLPQSGEPYLALGEIVGVDWAKTNWSATDCACAEERPAPKQTSAHSPAKPPRGVEWSPWRSDFPPETASKALSDKDDQPLEASRCIPYKVLRIQTSEFSCASFQVSF